MRVEDALPRTGTCVEDQAVVTSQTFGIGNRPRQQDHILELVRCNLRQFARVGDMPLGDDENVRRCLRVDVTEGEAELGLAHDVRLDVSGDERAEEAVS